MVWVPLIIAVGCQSVLPFGANGSVGGGADSAGATPINASSGRSLGDVLAHGFRSRRGLLRGFSSCSPGVGIGAEVRLIGSSFA